MRVWRLVSNRWAATAFTGIGSAMNPGRWNQAGQAVVYTSEHLSLAFLEILANAELSMLESFSSVFCDLPEGSIETLDAGRLPEGWRTLVHPQWTGLQKIGSEWLASGGSLALMVPSAVLDGEFNVLINPGHQGFGALHPSRPAPFVPNVRFAGPKK